ncbi:MAG: TonB-dependent receptor plug domain-containing protein [Chitinivibrionales bacterium]|nr:TonB-dependent receptor plug domain-containing protein [Chitinivibrionales bacterium]
MARQCTINRVIISLSIFILFPVTVWAQIIKGTVVDVDDQSPCVAAFVYLEDTDYWTHTDLKGKFILDSIQPGTYTLVITTSGYKEHRIEDIVVSPGETEQDTIQLQPRGIATQNGGFLHGKISNAQTGDPVENVMVFLEGTDFKTTTDSLGKFSFAVVPSGTYSIIAGRRGFESASITDIEVKPKKVTEKVIGIGPHRRRFGAYVEETDTEKGSISGTVIEMETRQPLAAANIYVKGTPVWTYTDIDGRFTLPKVPVGNQIVTIALTGYDDTEIKDVMVHKDSTTKLTIYLRKEGGNQTAEDLDNIKFASLGGKVTDAKTGEPLANVPVFFEGTDFKTQSDSTGKYVLDSIPEGSYTLISLLKGYDAYAATGIELAPGEEKEMGIALEPRRLNDADMDAWFSRPGTITGRIVSIYDDSPLQDVVIFLRGTSHIDTTDVEGFYTLEQVPPTAGSYTLCGYKAGSDTLCRRDINILPEDMNVQNFAVELTGSTDEQQTGENRGTLVGKVVSKENGEPVVGANAVLQTTPYRGVTDFKGLFRITGIRPGSYSLVISQEGFATVTMPEITIEQGKERKITVEMEKSDVTEMQKMVVKSTAVRTTGAALLKERQTAISFTDAIGAQEISRTGASDAADAMKSVTGASVVGGKYVLIRGLPERYTITMLNGSPVPSPDPDKKAVNMDLFPAGMIENITTHKTFTPNLPGNFAGGVVDIQTKPFPDKFILSVSATLGYDNGTTFSEEFLTYEGGKYDWLGIDDGTRELPDPFNSYTKDELDQYTAAFDYNLASSKYYPRLVDPHDKLVDTIQVINNLAKSLDTTLTPHLEHAPFNQSYSLSIGNTFQVLDRPLGFIIGANYGNSYDISTDMPQREYFFEKWIDTVDNEPGGFQTNYKIDESAHSISWGALCNAAYKTSRDHTLNIDYMYTRNSSDLSKFISGKFEYYKDNGDEYKAYRLHYIERSLNYIQPAGEHRIWFGKQPFDISWRSSFTKSTQNEPDLRNIGYFAKYIWNTEGSRIVDTSYVLEANLGEPSHQWRELNEKAATAGVDFSLPFYQWTGDSATLSFGGLWFGKERERRQEYLEYQLLKYIGRNSDIPPDQYFHLDSIGLKEDTTWGVTFKTFSSQEAQWDGKINVYSTYGMFELPLISRLSSTAGVRYEVTDMEGGSIFEDYKEGTEARMNDHDILPGLSFNYELKESMNIRCAYGRTLVRPSLREKAPYKTESFAGGPSYQGNPDLKRSLVDNVDIRWEWFMNPGELLTAGGFYKIIRKPIELTTLDETNDISTHRNTDTDANIFGVEFEGRKNIGDFQLAGNLTLTYSIVKLKDDTTGRGTSKKSEIYFPNEPDHRPFQGQSPYVGNLFFAYDNSDIGLNLNLLYNVFGERLGELTKPTVPWIWEKPQHMINFTGNKSLLDNFSIKAKIKNILGAKKKLVYHYDDEDYLVEEEEIGRTFYLGFSYTF